MHICKVQGCIEPAKYQVGFQTSRLEGPKDAAPIQGWIGIAVCEFHKATPTKDELFPVETCKQLQNMAANISGVLINFQDLKIVLRPMKDGELFSPPKTQILEAHKNTHN